MKTPRLPHFPSLALLVSCLLAAGVSHAQTTVYSHSFGGAGGLLNGVAVDVANGPSATWLANSAFLDNGQTNGDHSGSALLNVTLKANAVYRLSVDITPQDIDSDWGGFGFASGTAAAFIDLPGADGGNVDRFTDGPGGRSWALVRDRTGVLDATDVEFFGGPGTGGGVNVDDTLDVVAGVTYGLEIILTTSADGLSYTVDLKVNGTSVLTGDGGLGTAKTISNAISTIGSVGLTFNDDITNGHIFDNFLLTEQVIGAPANEWNLDGNGNFGVAANWTLGTPAPNSDVLFGSIITANTTVTLDSPVQLNSVAFGNTGDGDYFLVPQSSETLTLTGSATVSTAGRHWLRSPVAGSAGLHALGTGELILDATNTFSGGLSVNDANVGIVNNGALPAGNAVSILTASELRFWGPENAFFTGQGSAGFSAPSVPNPFAIDGTGRLEFNDGADTELTGAVSGTGTLAINNADLTISNANPGHTGPTTLTSGTLAFGGAGSIAASSQINLGNGAALLPVSSASPVDGAGTINFTSDGGATGSLARMELSGGVTLTNPIAIAQRNGVADAIRNISGSNTLSGNITVGAGGSSARIQSDAGTLTLGGFITPTAANRVLYLQGAGNGNLTGSIDNSGNAIGVVKAGAGTWNYLAPTTYTGNTTVEAGSLVLGGGSAPLQSAVVAVRNGALLDISALGTYEPPVGQQLRGGGQINAASLYLYGDNSITPGDSVGTLGISGSVTLDGSASGGILSYELGDATTVGGSENDLLSITGPLTTLGTPAMTLQVTPVESTLATGSYRLVNHTGGAIDVGGISTQILSNNGTTLNPRQTFLVTSAPGQVNLAVSGSAASRTWNGSVGNSTWDTGITSPWLEGDQRFADLDLVTFGSAAPVKNVTVNSTVTPGSVTFNGGGGSTYVLAGTGGMAGSGPVNVNSGTVRFRNSGNNYVGTTTIANGARLETGSALVGPVVANGGLAVGGAATVTVVDDFSGSLASYTKTVILDANGGASNTANWQITGGALEFNTTAYDGIEQVAFIRSGLALAVGDELQVNLTHSGASQDLGLYVGGTTPVTGTRQDYVAVYARNNGQVFSRGFDGVGEYGLAGGATVAYDRLFIARTGGNTYEAGYYAAGVRTVIVTRTPVTPNDGDVVGFYADVRNTGVLGALDNLTVVSGINAANSVLNVAGGFALAGTGSLELGLSSAALYPSLAVSGSASLAGTVSVGLLGGYSPVEGASFRLINAAGGIVDGGFTLDLPALGAGLQWDTGAFATTGTLSVVAAGGGDYAAWIAMFPGVGGLTAPGDDADGDGLANAVEHVLGTDPSVANGSGISDVSSDGTTLVFRHPQTNELASDMAVSYGWSTDVNEWKFSGEANTGGTTATIATATIVDNAAPDLDLIEVTVTFAGTPADRGFARVVAIQNP